MADYSWGSDDWLAAQEDDRRDAAQEAYHASHRGHELASVEVCVECQSDVLAYPNEFLEGDDELFWAVVDQHSFFDPSEFEFVYQPQLRELGLI